MNNLELTVSELLESVASQKLLLEVVLQIIIESKLTTTKEINSRLTELYNQFAEKILQQSQQNRDDALKKFLETTEPEGEA